MYVCMYVSFYCLYVCINLLFVCMYHFIVCLYVCMYVCMYVNLMSIGYQIIKRHGEGITVTDSARCLTKGACDLHRPILIQKKAR